MINIISIHIYGPALIENSNKGRFKMYFQVSFRVSAPYRIPELICRANMHGFEGINYNTEVPVGTD